MNTKYKSHVKFTVNSPKLSKLRQKLSQLIKKKSSYMKIIFNNRSLIKGGVYIHKRKCGNPACKCATTDYRHASYYLYKSERGKNITIYLKSEEVGLTIALTKNYKEFRKARAELIKNEKEIMKVIDKIEKEKTIPLELLKRERKNAKRGKNKKKKR